MSRVANIAEGGTNGTTVTTANSGGASGAAFTTVNINTNATLKFDNTQAAHGTMSYRIGNNGTVNANSAFVVLSGAAAASYATRMYIRFNALPGTTGQNFLNLGVPGGIVGWRIAGTNQFALCDRSGNPVKTFATAIVVGTWYRLELEATAGSTPTNGYLAGRYFLGDSTTPAEAAFSTSSVDVGNGGPISGSCQFGVIISTPFQLYDLWIDDLAIADGTTTPIGPPLNQTWLTEDYAEVVTATGLDRRLSEDYAEVVTRTGVARQLSEVYAEVVTVWAKIRMLTEVYAEAVTPAAYPITPAVVAGAAGSWS